MERLNAIVAAYAIAFEGCISLSKTSVNRRKVYSVIVPSVQIAGVNKQLLDDFCSLVGYGKVYPERRKNPLKNQREVFVWRLSGAQQMKDFCEEILPYLPSKKRQAEIMIEFCERRKVCHRIYTHGGHFTTYEDRDWELLKEMQELNHRGLH